MAIRKGMESGPLQTGNCRDLLLAHCHQPPLSLPLAGVAAATGTAVIGTATEAEALVALKAAETACSSRTQSLCAA